MMIARLTSLLTGFGLFVSAVPISETITRDVVILGGGSTGTYAAIRLKDLGKSFVIVERSNRLGGHGETFYPAENTPINYGVEGLFNTSATRAYLHRLNVPYEVRVPASSNDQYLNLRTGSKVQIKSVDEQQALKPYLDAIAQFSFLTDGPYNLPDPVPEDLLLPFGDFVKKYNLEPTILPNINHGCGDIFNMMTLYHVQYLGIPHAKALGEGYLRPVNGMADIYTRAARELAEDVLFSTTAQSIRRSTDAVELLAVSRHSNGTTTRTLIHAKQLLVTIPVTLDNLHPIVDLDAHETDLFSRWRYQTYYAALVNNTGLTDGVNLLNIDPDNALSVPREPLIWRIDAQRVPDYRTIKLVGNQSFTAQDAQQLMAETFAKLSARGTYPAARRPHIVAWGDHTPSTMSVSADEIRNGFYRSLYGLQGRHRTFYTGLAWASDYSTLLWRYTDTVIEQMRAGWGKEA
ncbi:FAD/NAD(P)-binding domain-containing protein [Aspergillus homomorphus CBS 101889]|uniref:FAD/NAD(P)-binding domain-containing protein n=1 Tax=Aspergillus homomorphus (strain CBS 101889) TaxID=1450537 RepID=A0A395HGY7_ASPHC|nr:FAD/NAD(P)-binding domain-containing protein [Aspergillus homomorphus CBS 101889]RAL07020.1 FAD/NAD(P)-binding domain-containing protein [Aspergillus homomorphus CBS 101889]